MMQHISISLFPLEGAKIFCVVIFKTFFSFERRESAWHMSRGQGQIGRRHRLTTHLVVPRRCSQIRGNAHAVAFGGECERGQTRHSSLRAHTLAWIGIHVRFAAFTFHHIFARHVLNQSAFTHPPSKSAGGGGSANTAVVTQLLDHLQQLRNRIVTLMGSENAGIASGAVNFVASAILALTADGGGATPHAAPFALEARAMLKELVGHLNDSVYVGFLKIMPWFIGQLTVVIVIVLNEVRRVKRRQSLTRY
jgi:hypothetical protein